jgi:hypothetical protein
VKLIYIVNDGRVRKAKLDDLGFPLTSTSLGTAKIGVTLGATVAHVLDLRPVISL